jgi:ArsR family metal-binding transcriptional regulator
VVIRRIYQLCEEAPNFAAECSFKGKIKKILKNRKEKFGIIHGKWKGYDVTLFKTGVMLIGKFFDEQEAKERIHELEACIKA